MSSGRPQDAVCPNSGVALRQPLMRRLGDASPECRKVDQTPSDSFNTFLGVRRRTPRAPLYAANRDLCDLSGKNTRNDDEINLEYLPPTTSGDFDMSNSDASNCSSSKCTKWCFIFAILHLLVLTCIAASLWNIDDAILASKAVG